ncbi:MAG: molybdopterin-binding protein, partial [Clostridiales Family XIII bacterium]|nr:molybdopterin-binding protein [Clostridiales Family XIII bacterium]
MKEVRTADAVGMVIAHDITRIIPGTDGVKEVAFRKGHIVRQEDVEALHKIGKKNLFVWADEPGLVHENDAAAFLYKLVAGAHMHPEGPVEGKINVVADADGLLRVDKGRLLAVNRFADAMVASRHDLVPVRKGDRLAGTRAIPLAVRQTTLDEIARAVEDAPGQGHILTIRPFLEKTYGIVNTGSELYEGLIEDGFSPVVRAKLAEYGAREVGREVVP